MRLVEIKNNLAKLYYHPADFPLVLSDFLTIDDGNQKILAQIVTIETTNKGDTNCAVLKFSLNLDTENSPSSYDGYVPSLDALVSQTQKNVVKKIFSKQENSFVIGKLTNKAETILKLDTNILEKFLYIQSDKYQETEYVIDKITKYCTDEAKNLLIIETEDLNTKDNENIITIGKEFKLPINNDILNYIYENDLTGLTVEQKTIVQDIILEIQEYIDTLDSKYIPFNTLLQVVNDIYESDKSIGIILLRNKLLKYQQLDIFASNENEINAIQNSIEQNNITVLNIANAKTNWQKEVLNFVLNTIKNDLYLILKANNQILDKSNLQKIYKSTFRPILVSKYDSEMAQQIKYLAKNLILFKPEEQQKSFATYNSFLNKLSDYEFIVSGESTLFTPLIVQPSNEFEENLEQNENIAYQQNLEDDINEILANEKQDIENILNDDVVNVDEESSENISKSQVDLITDDDFADLEDLKVNIEQDDEKSDISSEDTIENEIAKDVDEMFFTELAANETQNKNDNLQNENEIIIQDETIIVEEEHSITEELLSDNEAQNTNIDILDEINQAEDESLNYDDLDFLDELNGNNNSENDVNTIINNDKQEFVNSEIQTTLTADTQQEDDFLDLAELEDIPTNTEEENSTFDLDSLIDEPETLSEKSKEIINSNITNNTKKISSHIETTPNIPIYKTELDKPHSEGIKISEGNIVYHEKYGRGVVEQLITYGNKILCSIQFDNVGRRLLDPSLADLKQM